MSDGRPTVTVTFGERLVEALGPNGLDVIERDLHQELAEMLDTLDLGPQTLDVRLEQGPEHARSLVRVAVNGEPCEWPPVANCREPGEFVDAIVAQVFWSRECLVNDEFMRATASSFRPGTAGMSEFDAAVVVTEAVRRGFAPGDILSRYVTLLGDAVRPAERAAVLETVFAPEPEITVMMAPGARATIKDADLEQIQEQVFTDLGVLLPKLQVVGDDRLRHHRSEFRVMRNRLRGPVVSGASELAARIEDHIKTDLHLRVSLHAAEAMLARLMTAFPMPVFNAIEVFGSGLVHRVLRLLVEEHVSIRDLRGVLGAILEVRGCIGLDRWYGGGQLPTDVRLIPRLAGTPDSAPTVDELADYARICLRDQICSRLKSGSVPMGVWPVSDKIEGRLRESVRTPLSRHEVRALIDVIVAAVGDDGRGPLLVSFVNRRSLRRLIQRRLPRLAVLCPEELSSRIVLRREPPLDCTFATAP